MSQKAEFPRLQEIVEALGGSIVGDAAFQVQRLSSLDKARACDLSFLVSKKHLARLLSSHVGAVILPTDLASSVTGRCALIVTPDPYLYFARLTQWWVQRERRLARGGGATSVPRIHPTAVIDTSAKLSPGVHVGAYCVVEAHAVLGAGVELAPHVYVGVGARIGEGSRLAPHVFIGENCTLGSRCILHSGAVIGADGFGFAPSPQGWVKIEQLGAVRIGDDVEIGAQTCIDRGALDDTVVEDGVKLDNLIQIAHNVHIGRGTAMAACVGVAGSARIGAGCTVGGGAGILGHLALADGVHVSSFSLVTRSLNQPGEYSGVFPLDEKVNWEKNAATLRQLHKLRERLRALEKKQGSES